LVATSQKTQFWYSKNGKALFVGWNENRPPCSIPRATCVPYGLFPTKYAMIRVKPSLFDLKAMQPRTW
jgi:hypothetical protein